MIPFLLLLILISQIPITILLRQILDRLNPPDFSKEDSALQDASRIVAEAKQRIPKE